MPEPLDLCMPLSVTILSYAFMVGWFEQSDDDGSDDLYPFSSRQVQLQICEQTLPVNLFRILPSGATPGTSHDISHVSERRGHIQADTWQDFNKGANDKGVCKVKRTQQEGSYCQA